MRRVVITGMGIVSSIGNNKPEVLDSLKAGRSGIVAAPEYTELGMRSQVHGKIDIDAKSMIDRKIYRFMGDAAAFSYIAMQEAIDDAGLSEADVQSERTGLILGTGGASPENIVKAADALRERGIKRVGPYMVTKTMASTIPACVSTPFKIRGVSYTISSACSTSAHCIGHGAELIQFGKNDIVFAGGGEEVHWAMSVLFDGMGAMSSNYNDNPERAWQRTGTRRTGSCAGAWRNHLCRIDGIRSDF
jgi:3-oxoacyl-[acyl-carrier-protein] synthase-1